ncbi:MAG: aspartate kinase [Spirochaetes bacterium RBG_16_67_19]|nr:MAG: aspartate kinase [Spirochaetes bacterium GWB1_66_5]OHD74433.1 MAG: aspartate kinase [Spirochaetes bacterium RBG_16_67_19]
MGSIVCKFGGTSVADAAQIRKIQSILRADPRRRYVVVSAPGKRSKDDKKVTDLLYLCHELASAGLPISEAFHLIRERFLGIAKELGVRADLERRIQEVEQGIQGKASRDWVASRGEYLSAVLVAEYLQARFVDTEKLIKIREDGRVDESTYGLLGGALQGEGMFVVPGFYGSTLDGRVKTFSRGGSDITGAIVARAAGSEVYENWTDVSGFLMTDPRIVKDPRPMRRVTYREIRELAYMGANVFHEEAIFPVYAARIPINIRNTNAPADPGTLIVNERSLEDGVVVGIAGKQGFSIIFIEKMLMNKEVGFGRRLFSILEAHGISFEHAPSGIDTMSVIVADSELKDKSHILLEEMQKELSPDSVEILPGYALIATVGEGMSHHPGIAGRLFGALGQAGVNVRIIDQGSSEINIIVGVESKDYEKAVNAIYQAFCGK